MPSDLYLAGSAIRRYCLTPDQIDGTIAGRKVSQTESSHDCVMPKTPKMISLADLPGLVWKGEDDLVQQRLLSPA